MRKNYLISGAILLITIFSFNSFALSDNAAIDTHEHIQSISQADNLIKAMDAAGIEKTVIVGTPIETLTLNGKHTFTEYQKNNDEILNIVKKYPGRFYAFCTISPLDTNALDILKDCHERGAAGLKLYNGHSYYYDTFGITLDSEIMDPVYAYAEKENMPVLYHVNIKQYGDELENVLKKYPDLKVSIPHFMVTALNLKNAERILDTYPNTYTDVSFGSDQFLAEGFMIINNNPDKFSDFIRKYQDRILFGTDMVLTDNENKDPDYIKSVIGCYKDLLEKKNFKCPIVTKYFKTAYLNSLNIYKSCKPKIGKYCKLKKQKYEINQMSVLQTKKMNGLSMGTELLQKIYSANPEKFLSSKQSDTNG